MNLWKFSTFVGVPKMYLSSIFTCLLNIFSTICHIIWWVTPSSTNGIGFFPLIHAMSRWYFVLIAVATNNTASYRYILNIIKKNIQPTIRLKISWTGETHTLCIRCKPRYNPAHQWTNYARRFDVRQSF